MATGARTLRIGDLAQATGFSPKTIRFYESVGLLQQPERSESGYRLYGEQDAERLIFIRKAKMLDLSLEEVRRVLSAWDGGQEPCPYVRSLLDEKIRAVRDRVRALRDLEQALVLLRRRADDLSRPQGEGYCPIIESVTDH